MATDKQMLWAQDLLSLADIQINGKNPWDIQVKDDRFAQRVLSQGSLGLGESYMDGWWQCEALDVFFEKILLAKLYKKVKTKDFFRLMIARFFNLQNKILSQTVAKKHYDLDNFLFENMLGKSMSYTCAYWKNAQTLDEAQHQKHDLICKKLQLKRGEKVLELGCGWGGFARFAAEHYGCEVTAVNISKEQIAYAKEQDKHLPIQYYLCDYRDSSIYNPRNTSFDKVVSIGLCEHIGYKNYHTFIQVIADNLKEDGLFLLHTIGSNAFLESCDPWTDKYLFPHGHLPAIRSLGEAFENRFIMQDWHNFGIYYDPTLMAWYRNFLSNWDKLRDKYDERFFRMWSYYLLSCAGLFRAGEAQLWQIVLSKKVIPQGYQSIR